MEDLDTDLKVIVKWIEKKRGYGFFKKTEVKIAASWDVTVQFAG